MSLKKRILCFFMSIVLILSTVMAGAPSSAMAAGSKNKMIGKTFTSGKYRYKVVSVKKKSGTVTLTGAKSKSITSLKMPETVKKSGYTFKVTAVSNNAFKGYKKLKSVTTNTQLQTIGKNAFNGCSKLKDIDIDSTKLKSVGKNALKGISAKAVIEVPTGKVSAYQKLLKSSGTKSTITIQAEDTGDETQADDTGKTGVTTEEKHTDVTTEEKHTDAAAEEEHTEVTTEEQHTHSYPGWVTTVEASCTKKGQEKAVCDCGQTAYRDIPALGHNYADNSVVDREATCTQSGSQSRHCTRCDAKTEVKSIPALGHSFSGWVEVRKTNCVESGLEKRICDRCGLTENRQIAMAAHNLKFDHETQATCTSGSKAYSICTVCGQVFFSFTSKALGHDFEEGYTTDKEPTCNPGSKSRHCIRPGCDAKTDVTVIPAEHAWGEYVVDWEGCESTGRQHRTCTVCKTTETVTTPALGHDDSGEFVHEKDASCTEAGVDRKRCSRCNAIIESKTIPALGHDFSKVVSVDVEATCQTEGLETRKCSRCDKEQAQAVRKTGHKYADSFTLDAAPGCNFGIQSRHCVYEGCDAYTDWTMIPGTGHNFDGNGHCMNEGCDTIPDINNDLDYRFVWAVAYTADMERCEGFVDNDGNHVASTYKTTIIDIERVDGKPDGEVIKPIFNTIEMTAPAAKPGYKFAGWRELKVNSEGVLDTLEDGSNPSRTDTWKSMGKVFEAVYEPI